MDFKVGDKVKFIKYEKIKVNPDYSEAVPVEYSGEIISIESKTGGDLASIRVSDGTKFTILTSYLY